jgi:hypothetical protein
VSLPKDRGFQEFLQSLQTTHPDEHLGQCFITAHVYVLCSFKCLSPGNMVGTHDAQYNTHQGALPVIDNVLWCCLLLMVQCSTTQGLHWSVWSPAEGPYYLHKMHTQARGSPVRIMPLVVTSLTCTAQF